MSQTTTEMPSTAEAITNDTDRSPITHSHDKHNPPNQPQTQPPPDSNPHPSHLTTAHTATIMTCLCASVFVAALDITIVAAALPAIAAHFASPAGYTWIGTAFVLAHTASTPSWGKLSDIWGRRPVLLAACAVFFAGSLLCALAGGLEAFVAARALQGLGAAGMQTMVNVCIGDMFSQRDRGLYYGLTSVVWAVASGVGPVMGGVFTDKLGWRWCFWINLPIIGAVFLLLLFTLKLPSPHTPIRAGLKAIDWSGSLLIIGGTLMLLVGLYLGGVHEPWHSAVVVCLLTFGCLAAGLFILNEWKLAAHPVMPPRLFRTWSSAAAYGLCFFHGFVFMGVAYYLPLYFQSVLLASPLMSGLYMLPFIVSSSVSAAITGVYIQKTGRYMPPVWIGMPIMTLGIGLLIDMDTRTNWAKLVMFQLVGGFGTGMNFEGPLLAVQAVVVSRDVAAATTTMGFLRTISTAISVVVGGVVFQNEMGAKQALLKEKLGPQLAQLFNGASASANVDAVRKLPEELQHVVRQAFYESMRSMWIVYVVMAVMGMFVSFFIRSHHLSKQHVAAQLGLSNSEEQSQPVVAQSVNVSEGHEMQALTRRA